jgi:sialidase-1
VAVLKENVIWASGEGSYRTYRIPALVKATKDTLLAFCEGRRDGRGDEGPYERLVYARFDVAWIH